MVIVASNNLTAGGLFKNYEAGTCMEFDLTDDADLQVHQVAARYIQRLREDETSQPLTEALIQQLLSDPKFRIGSEAEARSGRDHEDDDSLGISSESASLPPLFGKSQHTKQRDPALRPSRRATAPRPAGTVRSTPMGGGSAAEAAARWSKQLTRSDSGRPRTGSQTTAALRFTQAGQPIDQTRWFRERLFGDEPWQSDVNRAGREIVQSRFDVMIDGVPRGTHDLALKHDAVREAGQNNFTTDLKWGSLSPVLRAEDLTGKWVTIEKLSDGALRLIVADSPAGEFLA